MSVHAPSHPSLYRTIMREALSTAWHHPHLWVLAAFASLLMTGGMYDILLRSLHQFGADAEQLVTTTASGFSGNIFSWIVQPFQEIGGILGVFASATSLLGLLTMLLVLAVIAAGSVIAQGALVYGLGVRLRGELPALGQCLAMGTRFFWKTLLLNLFTVGLLWAIRSLTLVPITSSYGDQTTLALIGRVLALFVYVLSIILLSSTHMLALTSLILQKYSVIESFARGLLQARTHWLVILELGLGFLLLGAAIFFGLTLLYIVAGIPLLVLTLSAALLGNGLIVTLLNGLFFLGIVLAFVVCGSFATTLQYAAWNQLALRIAQGTALGKLHRWFLYFKPKR